MILGQDLLTELGLHLNFFGNFIEDDDGTFKMSTTLIFYLGTYVLNIQIQGNYT